MNEKIKLLADEAGMVKILTQHAHEYGAGTFEDTEYPELEKFAELLFNEIANTAVVSDGMFNGNERRLYVELRLGDMVKKISVLGFEE